MIAFCYKVIHCPLISIHFLICRFIAIALAISLHFSCEVFAEKDQQIVEEEIPTKEQAKPLGVGDLILKDIGFDIEADSLSEKIKILLFSQVQLDEVLKLIVDLDDEDFRIRNEASKKLAMHESPIGHLLVNLNQDLSVEMSRRVQAILNVRAKKRFTDVLYHALESELLDFTKLDLDSLLVTSSTFSPKVYSILLKVIENAAVRSATKNDIPITSDSYTASVGIDADLDNSTASKADMTLSGVNIVASTEAALFQNANQTRISFLNSSVKAFNNGVRFEGTDAQATVSVRIEEKGKTTVGQAADTDTLVASANAYLNALNKLIIKRTKTAPDQVTSAQQ